jgi:hypothetical protein
MIKVNMFKLSCLLRFCINALFFNARLTRISNTYSLNTRITVSLPISDRQDDVVDPGLLDDVVNLGLAVAGNVFPIDLKNLKSR